MRGIDKIGGIMYNINVRFDAMFWGNTKCPEKGKKWYSEKRIRPWDLKKSWGLLILEKTYQKPKENIYKEYNEEAYDEAKKILEMFASVS